jgi:hypothetical protein
MNSSIAGTPRLNITSMNNPVSLLTLVGSVYMLSLIGVAGFFSNIICLVVFFCSEFRSNSYKCQILKTLAHLFTLSLTATNAVYNCTTCPVSHTFSAQFYRTVFFFASMASNTFVVLAEIALSYDRLMILRQRVKRFINATFIIVSLLFCTALNAPYLFAFNVEQIEPNRFLQTRNIFGFSAFYRFYSMLNSLLQSFLSFGILLVLNFLASLAYRDYIRRKKNLIHHKNNHTQLDTNKINQSLNETCNSQSALKVGFRNRIAANGQLGNDNIHSGGFRRSETKFTLMIIYSSLIFTLTRLLNLVSSLALQIFPLLGMPITHPFINFIILISLLANSIYYACSIFIYLTFDSLFRIRFIKLFCFYC